MAAKVKVAPPDLRTDWADAEAWQEMARARKLRLPLWRMRCTRGQMGKWLKKLGLNIEDYGMWWIGNPTGSFRLMDFNKLNPDIPLRVWVGLMMELCDDLQKQRESVPAASENRPKRGRPKKAVPVAEEA